jgi:hypothetical protein
VANQKNICSLLRNSIIVFALMLTACGGANPAMTSAPAQPDYFPIAIGQQWQMVNDISGATTFFEVLPVGEHWGCDTGNLFDLHVTKTDAATYWAPNTANADLHFFLKREGANLIRSIGFYMKSATSNTVTVQLQNLGPVFTYTILNPQAGSYDSPYQRQVSTTAAVSDCMGGNDGVTYPWKTTITFEDVSTPAFTGRAIKAHYEEGNAADLPAQQIEDWYFAPNIGLIKIVDLREFGVAFNPALVITRR